MAATAAADDTQESVKDSREKSATSSRSVDSGVSIGEETVPMKISVVPTEAPAEDVTKAPAEEVPFEGVPNIERPKTSSTGAVAFDITFDRPKTAGRKRPPARLAKLDRKVDPAVTQRALEAKQKRADVLREQNQQAKVAASQMESEKVSMIKTHMVREKTILGDAKLEENAEAMREREQHLQSLRLKLQQQKAQKSRPRSLASSVRAH